MEPRLRQELFWLNDEQIKQLDQRGLEQLKNLIKRLPIVKGLLRAGDNLVAGEYREAFTDVALAIRQAALALRTRGGSLVGDMAYEGLGLTLEQIKAGVGIARQHGGDRNEPHSNIDAKDESYRKWLDAKADLERIKQESKGKPGRQKLIKEAEARVKHWQSQANFKGETHSRNAKGNNNRGRR